MSIQLDRITKEAEKTREAAEALDKIVPITKSRPAPREPHKNPELLRDLPYGLGDVQRYIYGCQVYPDMATAGVAALATFTMFAQSRMTIDSYGGLGFNEQYMVLAPTGGGKESLRKAIARLYDAVEARSDGNLSNHLPTIHRSAPASKPGLHQCLEKSNSLFYLADEFGEWLAGSNDDIHKRDALGYTMELYTSALAQQVAPSHAVTRDYQPIDYPRVSAMATSTPERMVEAMSASQADSGAFNRWVMYLADDTPPKRYEGFESEPDESLVKRLADVANTKAAITFSSEAWEYFKERDQQEAEPLKADDHALAGRLSEQAIKMAGLIALSDSRHVINRNDLLQAYALRVGVYKRVAEYTATEGAFSGRSATGDAMQQVAEVLERKGILYKKRIGRDSRKYKKLEAWQQQAVIRALVDDGRAVEQDIKLYWGGDNE